MINAIAVEFENILCFKERQRFEFTKGLHLITGVNLDFTQDKENEESASANNGIGKSALATIVRFACFGFAKDTNKNILINKEVGKNLRVRFEFSIKEDQYVIERYKKHHEHKENLYLFKNDEDISASNKTQTQQDIIDLLVITDDTYLKSSLFTREDNPQFLSLTPTNRSKIFENIVHLSKFKKKLENVKAKKKFFSKLAENVEIELRAEQKNYTNLIDTFQNIFYEVKEKRKEIINNIKNQNKLVSKELLEKYNKFITLTSTYESLNKKLEEESGNIESNKRHNDKIDTEVKNLQSKFDSTIEIIKDKEDHSKCENCQHIPKTITEQIITLKEKLNIYEGQIEKKKKLKINDREINERYKVIKERVDKVNEKIESLNITQKEIDLVENIGSLDAFKKELSNCRYRQAQLIIDKIRLSKLKVSQNSTQKKDLAKHLAYCDKAIALLDIDEEDSIKQAVMSDIVPVFNDILQKNVDYIFENQLIITFDNNLNESIVYKDESFEFLELSTGEKQRLDLCISFAIRKLTGLYLGGFNILFLDEIFSNIDEYFIIKFLKLINEQYKDDTAIYLISHSAGVRENVDFDSNINLVMENKASTFTIT